MEIELVDRKTTSYYLTMLTLALFLFSEFIERGPFYSISKTIDNLKIKYVLLLITLILNLMTLIRNKKVFKDGVFKNEAKNIGCAFFSLIIITIILQIKNGFLRYSVEEMFFTILPLIFVVALISIDYRNVSRILDNSFYIIIGVFLIGYIDILTPKNILKIDFLNSYSPFENGISLVFVCYELYYLVRYKKREARSTTCLLLTILTFKRVTVLKAILFYIFVPMLKNKKVPKILFIISIVFFSLAPLAIQFIYSDTMAKILSDYFGMSMNKLTMDRYARTTFVLENLQSIKYGYGSVTYFLTKYFRAGTLSNRSLHCDILKIYLECGSIGTLLFTYFHFSAVKNNIYSYILMLHVFTEMIINHPFGVGNVGRWIIMYLMIVFFVNQGNGLFYREGLPRKKHFKIGDITF